MTDEKKSGINLTIILPFVIALTTSIIAPLVVETYKGRSARLQQEKDRQDKISKVQFEILENINRNIAVYLSVAGFLVADFRDGASDNATFLKHKQTYEEAVGKTNAELVTEAFRARIYFQNDQPYDDIRNISSKLMELDRIIIEQQDKQGGKIVLDPITKAQWVEITNSANKTYQDVIKVLNQIFLRTGRI